MSGIKQYLDLPLRELVEDTAARSPTPGGGSVTALVGCLAAALGRMAVSFTIGKPRYAAHEERLKAVLEELRRSGDMFAQLAAEDMAAYAAYAASRKSADEAEQQRALLTAAAVPLEIVAVASAVLGLLDEIKSFTNPYLLSDLKAAALLVDATAQAAALNVRTNLTQLARPEDAQQLERELTTLLAHCQQHRSGILQQV